MTNEEMERAIDFLLKSQANFETRLEQREAEQARRDARIDERFETVERQIAETNQQLAETNKQLAETNKQLGMFADTQAEFIQVVTRTFDEQARINKSVAGALKRLAESQAHTDRRLDALIDIVRGGRDGG